MIKELRPYQGDFINTSIREFNNGVTKQLAVLFTGAGKTFTGIKLIERYDFRKVLWLSYQTELVSQSALAFIRDGYPDDYQKVKEIGFLEYADGEEQPVVGCIKAGTFKIDAPVIMGSVKTVWNRTDKIDPYFFDCIVCDEAHLFGAKSAVDTINYFKPRLLLGLTATPHRQDGMMLGDIFDKIIFEYGLDQGIRDGWACELEGIRVKTTTNLDKVHTVAGELNQGELADEVNTLARNQLIVEKYKHYASGRQAIAYCVDIQHAVDLAEQFRMNGIDCQAVSSNEEMTPDRSENIKAFTEGRLQVITNVNILVAGFDHPDTGCMIMACPTKSLTKYLQAVGRGARLKSDAYVQKYGQRCIILDIVDVTSRHNLVNAWELDKQKPPEERVFITSETREKLLEARRTRLEVKREKDEVVKLLPIPRLKISKSIRMTEEATAAQLACIEKWGYDIKEVHYTKKMVAEIFAAQPATVPQILFLKNNGYDIASQTEITLGMFQEAKRQIDNRPKFSTK